MLYSHYKKIRSTIPPHIAWVASPVPTLFTIMVLRKGTTVPASIQAQPLKDIEEDAYPDRRISDNTEVFLQGPLSAQDEFYTFTTQ